MFLTRSQIPVFVSPEIPMALERCDVEKIAHLARLGLNDGELPRITDALNSILGLVDQMQAVDTTGIEPLAHPRRPASVCVPTSHREQPARRLPGHRAIDRKRSVPVPKVIE